MSTALWQRPAIPAGEFTTTAADSGAHRATLAAKGIDVFFLSLIQTTALPSASNIRVTCLTHQSRTFEGGALVVPVDGKSFIATGPESEAFVYVTSYCRDVRVVDAFTHPNEEYPYSTIHRLADALGSLHVSTGSRGRPKPGIA